VWAGFAERIAMNARIEAIDRIDSSPFLSGSIITATSLYPSLTLVVVVLAKNCCDKNVIVPCSERVRVEQNGSERISGNWLKNQVE
jgi:hypothetical protein